MTETDPLETRIDALEARISELEQQLDSDAEPTNSAPTIDDIELVTGDESRSIRQVVRDTITEFERIYGEPAPIEYVVEEVAAQEAEDTSEVAATLTQLLQEGSIYKPTDDLVRVV